MGSEAEHFVSMGSELNNFAAVYEKVCFFLIVSGFGKVIDALKLISWDTG